jgi:hypothetical protein
MRKDGKKTLKGSRTKKAAVKDLTVKDAKAVKGGRKAGDKPLEYLKVTMSDIIVTG